MARNRYKNSTTIKLMLPKDLVVELTIFGIYHLQSARTYAGNVSVVEAIIIILNAFFDWYYSDFQKDFPNPLPAEKPVKNLTKMMLPLPQHLLTRLTVFARHHLVTETPLRIVIYMILKIFFSQYHHHYLQRKELNYVPSLDQCIERIHEICAYHESTKV